MMKINMEVYLNHEINNQAPHSWAFLFMEGWLDLIYEKVYCNEQI